MAGPALEPAGLRVRSIGHESQRILSAFHPVFLMPTIPTILPSCLPMFKAFGSLHIYPGTGYAPWWAHNLVQQVGSMYVSLQLSGINTANIGDELRVVTPQGGRIETSATMLLGSAHPGLHSGWASRAIMLRRISRRHTVGVESGAGCLTADQDGKPQEETGRKEVVVW